MKCSKCLKNNIKKSNYCKYCGKKFSEKEKKEAKEKGFVAFLKRLDDWYDICTLKVITDSIWFKIGILLVILMVGIYSFLKIGHTLKILDGDLYDIKYNKDKQEYYIVLNNDKDELYLNMFIPNKDDYIYVNYYSEDNKLINKEKINKDKKIILKVNSEYNNYYLISDDKTSLKVFVYFEGEEK